MIDWKTTALVAALVAGLAACNDDTDAGDATEEGTVEAPAETTPTQ